MNGRTLLAGVLGGVVLFIWLGISWGALPFHMDQYNAVPHSTEIDEALRNGGFSDGMNYYPAQAEGVDMAQHFEFIADKPVVGMMTFATNGSSMSATAPMVLGLLGCIIAAILVAMFLSALPQGATRAGKVLFCIMFGVAAFFCTHWMTGAFFYYPMGHLALELLDGIIGWALAGMVMAMIVRSAVPPRASAA